MFTTKLNRIAIGKQIEELAIIYLQKKNLVLLEKNFRTKFGEIDLIFQNPLTKQIIFVEVRYRKSILFGDPAETITKLKQKKIIRTANYFLNNKFPNQPIYCRFDIIACTGQLDNIKINWIQAAFYANRA
ncbi:MAG: YraN family protein [Gammaproteobacteria bacterium]|jgi:putative endonuclease